MILDISDKHLASLKEQIEGCDFCYLCDCHPGDAHHGHGTDCPLRAVWHDEGACEYCAENRRDAANEAK